MKRNRRIIDSDSDSESESEESHEFEQEGSNSTSTESNAASTPDLFEESETENKSENAEPSRNRNQITLKKVRISGFKCYEDETIEPIHPKMNFVVGSNGVGKSAILDAICFAFGYRARNIQGKNVDDLIRESQQNADAIVSLEFSNGLLIQRKATRGEGSSYSMATPTKNVLQSCSRDAVYRALLDIGIDINNTERFILMQSKTVAPFFGQAFGLLKFLEEAFGNGGLSDSIEGLKTERTAISEETAKLEGKIKDINGNIAWLEPEVEEFKEFKEQEKVLESRRQQHMSQKLEYAKWIESLKEQDFERASAATTKIQQCTDAHQPVLARSKKEFDKHKSLCDQAQSELVELSAEWKSISGENARVCAQARRHRDRMNRKKRESEAAQQMIEEIKAEYADLAAGHGVDVESECEKNDNEIGIATAEKAIDDCVAIIGETNEKIASIVEDERKEEEEGVEENELQHISMLEAEVAKLKQSERELGAKLQQSQSQSGQNEENEKRKGYKQKQRYASRDPDYLGFLHELGMIKEEYRNAAESVIGSDRLENTIVVRTRDAALRVIHDFRQRRLGRATCLILEELPHLPASSSSTSTSDPLPLINSIETDDASNLRAFNRYLNNWFLTDRKKAFELTAISKAKSRASRPHGHGQRQHFVTLDGEKFYSNGEIVLPLPSSSSSSPSSSVPTPSPSSTSKNMEKEKTQLKAVQARREKALVELEEAYKKQRKSRIMREERRRQLKLLHSQVHQVQKEKQIHEATIESLKKNVTKTRHQKQKQKQSSSSSKEEKLKGLDNRIVQANKLIERCNEFVSTESELEAKQRAISSDLKKRVSQYRLHTREAENMVKKYQAEEERASELYVEAKQKHRSMKAELDELKQAERRAKAKLDHAKNEVKKIISTRARPDGDADTDLLLSGRWRGSLSEAGAQRKLVSIALQIEAENSRLEEKRAQINPEVMDKCKEYQDKLRDLESEVKTKSNRIEEIEDRIDSIGQERFREFKKRIGTLNSHLQSTYQKISKNGDGECYLSHAQSYSALFGEGVTYHVKPDKTQWKSFAELSGGQQALAALALHMALHRAEPTPCPLYLFDEVDASLDSAAARRVHQHLITTPGQLITCTLRELWDMPPALIGVYQANGSSKTCVRFL